VREKTQPNTGAVQYNFLYYGFEIHISASPGHAVSVRKYLERTIQNVLCKRCHLGAEIIAIEALASCPHLPGLAQAPTPACRGRRRSRSRRLYRETMAVVAGVLTLPPTHWGGSRASRATGEISMPRVAGVRALRRSSHRSPLTKVLILAQLARRISALATTHAKLYILATAWFGSGFESNLEDWFDYLLQGFPI